MKNIRSIEIKDFEYELPEERIAKYPLEQRDACKLLICRDNDKIIDTVFSSLPSQLPENSVLIYNNSKVINARLKFRKGENEDGAAIEIFCLEPSVPSDYELAFSATVTCSWRCFVGNSKKWRQGTSLKKTIEIGETKVRVLATRENLDNSLFVVTFNWDNNNVTFAQIIENIGEIPIPPYLNRRTEQSDSINYQTVYSLTKGSVAAPTAGLHFTKETLKEIDKYGILRREVTLHVGAGTFQPVSTDTIGEHSMHFEYFQVNKNLIADLIIWKTSGKKTPKTIVAVGTTTIRTLESLYYIGCLIEDQKWEGIVPQWYPYSTDRPDISLDKSLNNILDYLNNTKTDDIVGETQLLIGPGFKFRIVDALITNFHQPASTLLLLISAFLGRNDHQWYKWRDLYQYALDNDYRFLSYGDACLFL